MSLKLSEKKLAVLGAGKLGGILLREYLKQGLFVSSRVTATVKHAARAAAVAKELDIAVTTDNREAVRAADVILLTVKPQTVAEVLQEIAPEIGAQTLLVSVAASVPTSYLEQQLAAASGGKHNEVPVVRAMPNTPAAVGCGMTAICPGNHAGPGHLEIARSMFDAVGRTIVLDEKHMDAVTGLSASGPAFAYIILESLAEAGVKVGLPRDVATLLAAQTMKGSASVVLETGDHPALLKDAVTTPAGCTIDGILELEEGKLRVTLIKAVVKATSRASELLLEK
jgi:pyrroline-5-carboxylate reductase